MPVHAVQQSGQVLHKKNAWWRLKPGRSVRRLPYVISEGSVWFGRKAPGGRAWVWLEAREEDFVGQTAANNGKYLRHG
jgi:hypothetical protein